MDPRDEMLRDAAKHRGFKLVRSRRRKPGGDFGKYGLVDAATGEECLGIGDDGLTAGYEEVESFLRGRTASDWRKSLAATPAPAKPKPPPPRKRAESRPRSARKEPKRRSHRRPAPPPPPAPAPSPPPLPPPPPPPAPTLAVRQAKSGDAKALATLLGGIGDAVDAAEMRRRIERAARAGERLIVADLGGLVGCVAWHALPVVHRLHPIGRIVSLYVAPDARNRGIGTALIEAAEAALREAGCTTIEAMSPIDFDSPHSFFRKAGYRQTAYRFTREAED